MSKRLGVGGWRWVGALSRVAIVVVACSGVAACDVWMSADQKLARARSHFDDGKYRSAMAEVKTLLEDEPQNAQARLLLAEVSLWIGDLETAEKELSRAVEAGLPAPAAAEVRYRLLIARHRYDEVLTLLADDQAISPTRRLLFEARAHHGRDDDEKARAAVDKALAMSPDDPAALLELARLEAAHGESRQALEAIDRITQPDVMKARALFVRGSILMARGEHEHARDALTQAYAAGRKQMPLPEQAALLVSLTEAHLALADTEAAGQSLAHLAAWAPEAVVTHYLRARIAMLKNDPVAAAAECQRALAVDPGHVPSQLLLAAAHLSHGSLEQAESVLNRLLASNPGNVTATKMLAQVYLGRHEPQQARRLLGTVAHDSQPDAQLDWLMGAALLQTGDAGGLASLERSLAATPQDVQRRLDVASAYIAARNPDKALELLKAVPSNSPLAARAQALVVVASVAGKRPEDAAREIERLVAGDRDNVDLLTAAGAQLATSGEPQKAQSLLERAVQLDPKAVHARWVLAQLAARTQDFDRSGRYLQEILAIDPRDERAHVGLAEIAWRNGDRAGAQKWLEKAVGANPGAIEARLRLAQLAFVAGDAARGRDLLNQTIEAAGDRKGVLNAAGGILARAGFVEDALTRFKEAAAAGVPAGVLNAARLCRESGRAVEARQLLEAALVDKPAWAEAQRMLVEMDASEGHVDRALARVHSMSTTMSPATLREYEGDVYMIGKQYKPALAAYEEAQRKEASAAVAMKVFRARLASRTASPERSLTDWLRHSPADAEVRRLLAAYYEASGRPKEAMGEYERMLADDRIDPISLNNFAWMLHERGDARAASLAKRAYDAAPQLAEVSDTYGWILVQTDKLAEGLEVLERALAGAPANPDIQYHVAAAYVKAGQSARGGELLRQTLQDHEQFSSRQAAEELERSLAAGGSP